MDALRSLTMVSDSSSCVRLSPAFSSSSSCASSCSPTLSCSSSLSSRSSCSLHPRANSPTSQPLSSFVPIERIDSSIHLHRPHHTHPLPSQYYPHHSDYSGASHTVSSTYPTNDSSILLHRTLNIDEFDRTLSEARDEPISCESPHPPAPHQPTPSFFSSPSCSSFYSFPADYHVDCARPAGHLYHRFDDDHRLDQQYHHHLHTHVLQRASKLGTFGSSSPRSSSRSSSRSHLYVKRTAANLRERRRMQSINEAFEFLRKHIPKLPYEKRLSKVDTLKLAISYIAFLNEIVSTGATAVSESVRRAQQKARKVVLQCHRDENGAPVYVHSLSWNFEHNQFRDGNIVLTRLWTPEDPRSFDASSDEPIRMNCLIEPSAESDIDESIACAAPLSPNSVESSSSNRIISTTD